MVGSGPWGVVAVLAGAFGVAFAITAWGCGDGLAFESALA
jgi:hypothetical protein